MPISKRLNLRELWLKLFEIPYQHFQFFHSFFIPFENFPETESRVFTGLRIQENV